MDSGLARAIILLVLSMVISACNPSWAVPNSPIQVATHVLEARPLEGKQRNANDFQQVERRLENLYANSSPQADEAVVILMSFYLGESNGEELYENLLSRGPRMIPIIERYLQEPPSLVRHYPKTIVLERTTTELLLKESLEILKVQAGARTISSTTVDISPLHKQSANCKLKLSHRPEPKFPDNLIQSGETYSSMPVLKVDIQEDGTVTNQELVQQSGIRRLDALLLRNVTQWKYEPRPGCGVVQSNIAINVDWTDTK